MNEGSGLDTRNDQFPLLKSLRTKHSSIGNDGRFFFCSDHVQTSKLYSRQQITNN